MRLLAFIGLLGLMVLAANTSQAQCNAELYNTKALKALGPEYIFSKTYRIDGRSGTKKKIEYTAVFSKDTSYQIQISGKDGGATGIIATLYDSKRNKIATNFNNDKFFDTWTYKCRSTGVYYLTFTFKDSQSFCGAAVIGFKR